jgi:hypothetical protein
MYIWSFPASSIIRQDARLGRADALIKCEGRHAPAPVSSYFRTSARKLALGSDTFIRGNRTRTRATVKSLHGILKDPLEE